MIDIIDPRATPGWDEQLARFPEAGFFHRRAWAEVLADAYGFTPTYLVASDGDRRVGLLPLMEVDSWLTGRRGASLPFTDDCAPLATTAAVRDALHARALELGRDRRWTRLELRGGEANPAGPAAVSYWQHTLELSGDPADAWHWVDGAVRRAVRKAERSGLEVGFAQDRTAVDAFYALFCETRRKHGAPPPPRFFFEVLSRRVFEPGLGCLCLARFRGEPVAGAVFLRHQGRAVYKFGASAPGRLALRPNNLVMWHAIERFCRDGVRRLDFGRTSLANEGLRRFKLSWGAVERRLDYVQLDCRTQQFIVAHDTASGRQAKLFRLLPRWALRAIGAAAYRHIA